MTINIALATYDGIILGCDSLSSIVERAIFPHKPGCVFATDGDGNPIYDGEGNPVVSIGSSAMTPVATTVFGGVKKMFELYSDSDTCVAAVTSGLAILGGVTIAEQAKRFQRRTKLETTKFTSVEEVTQSFRDFVRTEWEKQFDGHDFQGGYLPSVQFIVAGFGVNDEYGKVFKFDVTGVDIEEQFPTDSHMGICWAGQSDQVERLMMGIDSRLRSSVMRQFAETLAEQREVTIEQVGRALVAAGVELPPDLEIEVTEPIEPTSHWNVGHAPIDYGNLSTQYAVDLVEMLVNTQSGMQRFAIGIPTVGGRTHVGVLKRGEPFEVLNEPKLQHRHIGYADEY